ncbi:MAG: hypothetical protein FWD12_14465 [Alphaproteobacteria bacterium]|nr:hypothetical protein [Alphaproteobacteria bacterium]
MARNIVDLDKLAEAQEAADAAEEAATRAAEKVAEARSDRVRSVQTENGAAELPRSARNARAVAQVGLRHAHPDSEDHRGCGVPLHGGGVSMDGAQVERARDGA